MGYSTDLAETLRRIRRSQGIMHKCVCRCHWYPLGIHGIHTRLQHTWRTRCNANHHTFFGQCTCWTCTALYCKSSGKLCNSVCWTRSLGIRLLCTPRFHTRHTRHMACLRSWSRRKKFFSLLCCCKNHKPRSRGRYNCCFGKEPLCRIRCCILLHTPRRSANSCKFIVIVVIN
jgi:hypothetical protein